MRRHRWFLALLVVSAVGLPILMAAAGSASAERPSPIDEAAGVMGPFEISIDPAMLPPEILSGSSLLAPTGVERAPRPNQDPEVLADEDFEDAQFPPTGWQVMDLAADQDRVPARYMAAIETCTRPPFIGGNQAVWLIGGGSEGSKLPCMTAYPRGATINTILGFRTDLSNYPNGFRVNFWSNRDLPFNNAFEFGYLRLDNLRGQSMVYTEASSNGRWMSFQEPVEFAQAGGVKDVLIFFGYTDPLPTGAAGAGDKFGIAIDNVKIEGLPYVGPTDTPTPSITPTPRVSPTPTFTPTPELEYIHLPMAFKDVTLESLPPPQPPTGSGVEVRFGTGIDATSGALQGQGIEFPAGTKQLCTRIRYWGQPVGTRLRWQWYLNGNQISVADLNGEVSLAKASGFEYRCIADPYAATYEVRAYVGDAQEPADSRSATVLGGL